MRNMILAIAAVALLVACASKEEKALIKTYKEERPYHKQLQKSEKVQLYEEEVTKALLTATYLYEEVSDKNNDTQDEVFIVGVHIEDDEDNPFESGDYSLTLNGYAPKRVELLREGSPLLKDLSFVTEWGRYYRITFPHVLSKSFTLVFQSDRYGKGVLKFAKVAKYILTKRGI